MKFTPEFIEKVRDANNIVDIISQYTSFKNMSHNMVGLCPFPDHREKTASFSVSEPKQVYYCFGCKKSGNIINFLMDYNGMGFVDAIEYLAQRASIPIPEESSYVKQKKSDKQTLFRINLLAGAHFKNNFQKLPEDHPAKVYMKNRGLTAETLEQFKVGYSLEGWNNLSDYLQAKNAPMASAQSLGLIKAKTGKKEYFDIFRNRIMFPILSPKGDVLGFGGRTITNENPKYYNSPESEVFHKGKVFYGLNESAKYIRIEDQIIVVEGYMDLLALFQFGFKNVVATLGTALTAEHAKMIKRYTKNVLVLFDSDNAGQFAQERSLPILLSEGLLPKAILLDDAKDPDEFLKKFGADKFKEKLQSSQDLFFVIMNRILKGFSGSPTEKVQKFEQIGMYLLSVVDGSLRELYIHEVASRLGVSLDWILKALKKLSQETKNEIVKKEEPESKIVPPEQQMEKIKLINPPKEEVFLVNLALYKQDFMNELLEYGLDEQLTATGLDRVFKIAAKEYRQNPDSFARLTSTLCSQVDNPSIITKHLDSEWEKQYDIPKLKSDCLQRVKERFLRTEAATLMQDLRQNIAPGKLEQFMNVIRDRQSLNKSKD